MWVSCLVLLVTFSLSLAAPAVDPELAKLTTQVNDELSTYFSQEQLSQIFTDMANLFRSNTSIPEMAKEMFVKTRDVMSKEQQQECYNSIKEAMDSYGGADKMKTLVMSTLLEFGAFMADAITKDREEFAALAAEGKNEAEVNTAVFKRFQQYWNVEFGQKVIDVVKCSMSEGDWAIAGKDAHKYMKVDNFDMTYKQNC